MSWSVVEEVDDCGLLIAFHVIPTLDFDGEDVVSAAHEISETCHCHPFYSMNVDGFTLWTHHDPDHDKETVRIVQ